MNRFTMYSSSSQHEQQSQMGATNTTFGVVAKPEPLLAHKPAKVFHKKSASNDVKAKPKVPIFKKVPSSGKNGLITFAPVSTSPQKRYDNASLPSTPSVQNNTNEEEEEEEFYRNDNESERQHDSANSTQDFFYSKQTQKNASKIPPKAPSSKALLKKKTTFLQAEEGGK